MDPLSALRTYASPLMRALQLPQMVENLAAPKTISAGELQKLAELPPLQALANAPSSPIQLNTGGDSFEKFLGRVVDEVSAKQAVAGETVNGLLSGQNIPLHQAVIAMEEAGVSFQLMVEVRNKLLESYQELMRMQI
ncbi:MAG: flagellar hook-basal body complex protein FliE [Verrucomicrobiota bacterium]